MEEYRQEIVDNIKHEPEAHFTCYLPEIPESDEELEVKVVKIVLRKFDRTWKGAAKLFESYFACGKCEYASNRSENLNRHLKVCKTFKKCENCCLISKSDEIIECVFCGQQFNCNNCKSIHILRIHRKDSCWICTRCEFKTSNRECLRFHYQIHVKKFSCSTCEKNFPLEHILRNHQQQHRHGAYKTGLKIKYECTKCVHSFGTKAGLRIHERFFHSKLKLYCDICGKTKKTKPDLRLHMQIHQKVPCPICHHFLAELRLQSHIDKHSTTARFRCNSCDKVYYNLHDLNTHRSRKHKIEQVQCDLCQKFFKNKIVLRMHMRNHLMVPCPTCGITISKHSLNHHMKIHLSKRESLACAVIYRRQNFSSLKEVEEHKQIHIGPKSYKCPSCNHQTKTLRDMKYHMKCHQA